MTEKAVSLGFKKLSKDNWRLPDPINEYFIKLNLYTGEKLSVSDDERVEEFLNVELAPEVPIDVLRQFEVARGAMLYGCFFYPLFSLGADQLMKVAESAVTHKCLNHGLAKKTARYEIKLQKLKDHNYLTATEYNDWENLRKLRNELTHSKMQNIFPPFEAKFFLKNIADKINKLFQTP
ncbi:MAG TPA: hypothetical protein PKY59_01100 [Pyrinomonadaceae bacterium]|nr:hypothetical protein [Pyrinomonadaceae bacterium]